MSLLDETSLRSPYDWIHSKGRLAHFRYVEALPLLRRIDVLTETGNCRGRWVVPDKDINYEQHWKYVAREQYARALDYNPTCGLLYHQLALLAQPQSPSSPDAYFDAIVFQLFYLTKSLVVESPFTNSRDAILAVADSIIARDNKEAEEPASAPQTDKNHFLIAVATLILASQKPELLKAHGYETSKKDHLLAVNAALEKIGRPAYAEQTQKSRIRPRYVPAPCVGLLPPLTDRLRLPARPLALPASAGAPRDW